MSESIFYQQNAIFQGENIKNVKFNCISFNTGQMKLSVLHLRLCNTDCFDMDATECHDEDSDSD